MGSEAFVASGDKEKAERVSRNGRPTAATIEAADAARRRETFALGKAIVLSENSINDDKEAERRIAKGDASPVASPPKAEVESGATMTGKPFGRLRRGEIFLPQIRI